MDERVRVLFKPFDCDFRGVTLCRFDDGESYYTIVINENLSEEAKKRTFHHEISHIECGDFESDVPIDEIERMRHTL